MVLSLMMRIEIFTDGTGDGFGDAGDLCELSDIGLPYVGDAREV